PGRRLLIVTLCLTVLRAMPATKPVRPERAPFERPRMSMGAFTADEVMLTMRPKLRAIMASTVLRMSSIGVSMLASSALIHASRSHSWKSPGGGPPALLTRMSGLGQAARAAARPSGVVMSQTTVATLAPVFFRISAAVASRASRPRARMTSSTPSLAKAIAQPLPSPLLAAQTSAFLPAMPRSIGNPPRRFGVCRHHRRQAARIQPLGGRRFLRRMNRRQRFDEDGDGVAIVLAELARPLDDLGHARADEVAIGRLSCR